MKEKILFLLLFITTSLCAMDCEEEEKCAAEKWHLTHTVRLGRKTVTGEVRCMYPQKPQSEQKKYLQRLELFDEALSLSLVCKTDVGFFKIFTQNSEFRLDKEFSQRDLNVGGPYPGGNKVDCTPRFKQKTVKLEGDKLIIGANEAEFMLPPYPKLFALFALFAKRRERKIVSSTTYGHKEGDKIAVLFNTGDLAMFSKTENNEKPIVIEGGHYKKQKRKKIVSRVLMAISIPLLLLLRSNFARSIKYVGLSSFLLAAAAYYVNFHYQSGLLPK